MRTVQSKRENEKMVVGQMIALYCRKNHGSKELCPECAELLNYAMGKIDRCPFMETKSFCSNCKVHCYQNEYRQRIRQVMRFSGPRMIFVHPVMSVKHLIASKREKRRLNDAD